MILSGRSSKSIDAELLKYSLVCPVGCNNGTALYVDGNLLELTSLSGIQNNKIIAAIEKELVPYNISTNKGMYAPKDWRERLEKVLSSGRVPLEYYKNQHFKMFTTPPEVYGHTLFEQIEEVTRNEDFSFQKFMIVGLDPEQKNRLQSALEMIGETNVSSSSLFNLEVTHINGHKGSALKTLANHFNIPLENTVAIGDERNDIPMFQIAGLSIALGNAEEEVKKHSDVVTLTNDENGVAYALEKYILNN